METTVSRIYVFPSGARIDLKKIIMIGAIDKDQLGNIFIMVYVERRDKPIEFHLGYAIGKTPEDEKKRVFSIYQAFSQEWEQYTLQEQKVS